MVSNARKYDVSENLNHYRLDGIRHEMRENMSTRKGHIGLDARKFSCAKISTFTVVLVFRSKAVCTQNWLPMAYCQYERRRAILPQIFQRHLDFMLV